MILNENLFEDIELNEEVDSKDLYFKVLHFIDDLGYDSDIAKEFYQMDDVIDSLTRLLKRVEDYKKYESLKESKDLIENYSARWDNMVTYSNPIKQQYADLVNDQIYDALDNIDILAASKINDLPEQNDFGFDQAERVSKAIANLVRTMAREYFLFTDLKDESLEESLDLQTSYLLKKYAGEDKKTDKVYKWIGSGTLSLDLNPDDESASRVSERLEQDGFKLVDRYDGSVDEDSYIVYTKTSGEDKYLAAILFYDGGATLQLEINPEDEDSLEYFSEALKESIEYIKWVQLPDGKWKLWGSNNGPELDPEFLDRARKQNNVEYKDARVSKNGEYPEGVSEEDIYEKHRFTVESLTEFKDAHEEDHLDNDKQLEKYDDQKFFALVKYTPGSAEDGIYSDMFDVFDIRKFNSEKDAKEYWKVSLDEEGFHVRESSPEEYKEFLEYMD